MSGKLINVFIDEKPSQVPLGFTIMQSCTQVGIDVPKFCYHDKLLIAGNCRICLVELTGSKKLLASCAVHISENSYVYTNTARVKLARQNVLEFLLANHPLDCPICDQGGECDLQDITAVFGADRGRFYETNKRAVLNKDFGPLIRTSMNRCIHCTRCVRFLSFSAGLSVLGTLGRGTSTEIGTYVGKFLYDELSGNITDLCPVGALTSKPYSFKARPWELVSTEGLDVFDALNANLTFDVAANKICRVLPYANELTNNGWLTNRARYAYDGLFFQRLNSCLLQVSFLAIGLNVNAQLAGRLTKFFIKISFGTAVLVFLKKILNNRVAMLFAEFGAVTDLVTAANFVDFVSLLGGAFNTPTANLMPGIQDFTNLFLFNTSLADLSRIPSFCFLLGINPRLEAPLVNLRLTKLQTDFGVPFYRIGGSLNYYSFSTKFLSNSLNSFFRICEFKHVFCKTFYSKSFIVAPFILIGAQLWSSTVGLSLANASLSLVKRLLVLNPYTGTHILSASEFISIGVVGLYSGWIHALDLAVGVNSTKFSTGNVNSLLKTSSVFYNLSADSNFLAQVGGSQIGAWHVYQGSHGSGVAAFADLILPTTTYVERTVFYKNLLGGVQISLPAVMYSKTPKTDTEIFKEILTVAETFFFNKFFLFNYSRVLRYNATLLASAELFLPNTTYTVFLALTDKNIEKAAAVAEDFALNYGYSIAYWGYFSYTWKLNSILAKSYLNFFLMFLSRSAGKSTYNVPIASTIINYYADSALPILMASKTMNTCSSLYLKKNLSVLQLHL